MWVRLNMWYSYGSYGHGKYGKVMIHQFPELDSCMLNHWWTGVFATFCRQTCGWKSIKSPFFPQQKSPLNPSRITLVSPSKKAHKSSHQVPCPVCFLSKPRPPWTPFSEFSASIAMTNSASGSFLTLELFSIVQPWGSRKRRCNRNLTIGTMLWK